MTERDHQRIAEWIGDAFAILCVRVGSFSMAETNLRLAFESILRQLGTSPLREVSRTTPFAFRQIAASVGDLRNIIRALDACLGVFQRYDAVLTAAQRQMEILVRASRRYAEEEVAARQNHGPVVPKLAESASQQASVPC